MKKIAPKKMTLSRGALGTLSDKEIKAVLGGVTARCTTSVNVCCNWAPYV
jgi:hypothetical protein